MSYPNYEKHFVDSDGVPLDGVLVPESCINSTEWIIRKFKAGGRSTRSKAPMFAFFLDDKNSQVKFDASNDNVLDYVGIGLKDHPFLGLPKVGQGIALLRQTKTSGAAYDMHFGAVLASDGSRIVVSNMMAQVANEQMVPLEVVTVQSVREFAVLAFGSTARSFAAGLVEMT